MINVSRLPEELWHEILTYHGPLGLVKLVRKLMVMSCAAIRLQRKWREVKRPSWKNGRRVRVRINGRWRVAEMFKILYDSNWYHSGDTSVSSSHTYHRTEWGIEFLNYDGRRAYLFYEESMPCVRMRTISG